MTNILHNIFNSWKNSSVQNDLNSTLPASIFELNKAEKEIQKTFDLIGIKMTREGLFEADTNKPIKKTGVGTWIRDNGDIIHFHCDVIHGISTKINVKRGETEVLELEINWEQGEMNDVHFKTIVDNPKFSEGTYGFDKASVNYRLDKNGYELVMGGPSGEEWMHKRVKSSVNGTIWVSETNMLYDKETGKYREPGESLFYSPANGILEIKCSDDSIKNITIKDPKETSLYLFNKVSRNPRNVAAKEFALDCIALEVPKIREVEEELSKRQTEMLELTDVHEFDILEEATIEDWLSRSEHEFFSDRQKEMEK